MAGSDGPLSKGNDKPLSKALRLYLVTDSRWLGGRTLESCVAEAIDGGITFLQLREKHSDSDAIADAASRLLPLCRNAGIPLVIDDDIEAAAKSGADGVHVGQSDAACADARSILGPEAIIGVSAQTVEQALQAQAAGADYLGVGAMFPTSTKSDADAVSVKELAEICAAVDIPVVAIGGIDETNVHELDGCGIDGIAVISAILAAKDIRAATFALDEATKVMLGNWEAR